MKLSKHRTLDKSVFGNTNYHNPLFWSYDAATTHRQTY